ncbi:MAG: hypothetical protein ACD_58C00316G0010 [uncultured bacterium]|nr:MAG: hypothetical protein ACD_58C00316G0010 [uncultured bacterium]
MDLIDLNNDKKMSNEPLDDARGKESGIRNNELGPDNKPQEPIKPVTPVNPIKQVPIAQPINPSTPLRTGQLPNQPINSSRPLDFARDKPESFGVKKTHPENKPTKLKLILIIVGAFIVIAGAVYYFFFYQAILTINVEPNSAQVEIGGYSNVGNNQFKLKPGSYNLKVSLTDYVVYTQDLTFKPSARQTITVALNRQSEVVKLVDYPALFATQSIDKQSLVYLSNQGTTIYKIDGILGDTKEKPYAVTPASFKEISDIKWNLQNDLALVKQANRWYLYDFKRYDLLHQESTQWSDGIGNVAWSPDGQKVAYFFNTSSEKTLIRANKDNSEMERIYNFKDTSITNPKIYWSADGLTMLIIDNGLYIFDVYSKTLTQLKQFESVTDANFAPDSQHIIYEKDGSLYLINLTGENKVDLTVATPLNKTVWFDQNNLLYFITEGATDNLFKLNISALTKTAYTYKPNYTINAKNLIITSDLSRVIFNQDDFEYSLKLVPKEY